MKKLSVSSLKAEDIMTKTVFAFNMNTTVREAILELLDRKISGAPIIEPKTTLVLSIASEADLMKFAAMDGLDQQLSSFVDKLPMATNIISARPNDVFADVFKLFLTKPVRRVIITDDGGRLQGIISRRDIMRSFVIENPKK